MAFNARGVDCGREQARFLDVRENIHIAETNALRIMSRAV